MVLYLKENWEWTTSAEREYQNKTSHSTEWERVKGHQTRGWGAIQIQQQKSPLNSDMNNLLSTPVSFEIASILNNLVPNFSITAINRAPRKAIVHKTSYMIKKKGSLFVSPKY